MQTNQYLKIRETSIQLSEKIFQWGGDKYQPQTAAQKLNLWHNGHLVARGKNDMEYFLEYLLYYGKHKGQLLLDQFFDSDIALNDTEELILEGMVNANISIFEVNDVDASEDACRVFVTDLLNAGSYELINRGLATTASQGVILGMRLIEIANGVHMTSGASFAFDAAHKNKLLNDYSHQKFKARRKKLTSEELFLFLYSKSSIYGSISIHL